MAAIAAAAAAAELGLKLPVDEPPRIIEIYEQLKAGPTSKNILTKRSHFPN